MCLLVASHDAALIERLNCRKIVLEGGKLHRRFARGSAIRLLQAPASSLVTLFVVAVALLLPALLFSLKINLGSLLAGFQDSAQVTLYLQDSVSEAEGQEVSDDLLTRSDIKDVYYVSPLKH